MASADLSTQFQEPPVNELPEAITSTSTSATDDLDAQFQEPIPAQPSTSSTSVSSDPSALHKTTTEKLKDVVKKPFGGQEQGSHSHSLLGKKEITSPEMAAANEVLTAKDLKSP